MDEQTFQLRSEETGIQFTKTFKEALELARKDATIWKISFYVDEERIRLVRKYGNWVVEQLGDLVDNLIDGRGN